MVGAEFSYPPTPPDCLLPGETFNTPCVDCPMAPECGYLAVAAEMSELREQNAGLVTEKEAAGVEKAALEEAARYDEKYHVLTDTAFRVLVNKETRYKERSTDPTVSSIVFLDVDHFKDINEWVSHQAGDEVLLGIATRLSESIREGDAVGRLGGEEFGVYLQGAGASYAVQHAAKIQESLSGVLRQTPNYGSYITVSIGVAEIEHGGNKSSQDAIHEAAEAMRYIKHHGRDGIGMLVGGVIERIEPDMPS